MASVQFIFKVDSLRPPQISTPSIIIQNDALCISPCKGIYTVNRTKAKKIFGSHRCTAGIHKGKTTFLFYEDAIESGYLPCTYCKPDKMRDDSSRKMCAHIPPRNPRALCLSLKCTPVGIILVSCMMCGASLGTAENKILVKNGSIRKNRKTIIPMHSIYCIEKEGKRYHMWQKDPLRPGIQRLLGLIYV